MKPYQVYDGFHKKVAVIVARDPFEALTIAKERGIYAPMVDAWPVR